MTSPRPPKTIEAATELLARFASLGVELANVEAGREAALASTNAVADTMATPIVVAMAEIRVQLEPWWAKAAPALTDGKRKSIELGGCKIGTRQSAEKVEFALGDDKLALAALAEQRFRSRVTAMKPSLDRPAILAFLKGRTAIGATLKALGFRIGGGVETFFVSPIGSDAAKISAR